MLRQLQQVYPIETPEPAGLLSSITLRPYQRQSLAFMLAIERGDNKAGAGEVWCEQFNASEHRRHSKDTYERHLKGYTRRKKLEKLRAKIPPPADERRQVRSGWLCDEMVSGAAACPPSRRAPPVN